VRVNRRGGLQHDREQLLVAQLDRLGGHSSSLEAGLAISVLCGRLLYHTCRDDSSVISAMAFCGTGHGCKVLGRSVTFTPDRNPPACLKRGRRLRTAHSRAGRGRQGRGVATCQELAKMIMVQVYAAGVTKESVTLVLVIVVGGFALIQVLLLLGVGLMDLFVVVMGGD
jgi:hypothetical protein